jgi:hypothetical protein
MERIIVRHVALDQRTCTSQLELAEKLFFDAISHGDYDQAALSLARAFAK